MVVRIAGENPGFGYTRLCDVLRGLGRDISRSTIKRILLERGLEPAPERSKRLPWKAFLKAHWGAIAAADFFSVEVMTWHEVSRPKFNKFPYFYRVLRGRGARTKTTETH